MAVNLGVSHSLSVLVAMTALPRLQEKQCRWYYSAPINSNNADWELTDPSASVVKFNTGTDKNTVECPGRMLRVVHVSADVNQRSGTVGAITGTGHGYVQIGPGLFDGIYANGVVATMQDLIVRFYSDGQEDLYEVSGIVVAFN